MINNILERQELERTLEQAHIWLRSTDRALTALSKEEQVLLHRMYIYPQKGGLDLLSNELGVETSSLYRRRAKALKHFTLALYGIAE